MFSQDDMDSYIFANQINWDDLGQFNSSSQELKNLLELGDLDLDLSDEKVEGKSEGGVDSPRNSSGSPLPTTQTVTPEFTSNCQSLLENETSVHYSKDLMFVANQLNSNTNVTSSQTTTSPSDNIVNGIVSTEVPEWLAEAAVTAYIDNSLIDDNGTVVLNIQPPSPLETVTSTSDDIGISDNELISLSVKDLNRKLQSLPKDSVKCLKARRRTLKNRGYAAGSRERRQKGREELESENKLILEELRELQDEVNKNRASLQQMHAAMKRVQAERDLYKTECERLKEQQVPASPDFTLC